MCLSVGLYACLCTYVCLFVCMFVCLCAPVYMLSVCAQMYVYLSVCLSVRVRLLNFIMFIMYHIFIVS